MKTNHQSTSLMSLPTINNVTLPDIIIIGSIVAMIYGTGLIVFKVGSFFNQQKEALNQLTSEIKTLNSSVRHIDGSIKHIEDWAIRKGFKRNES